jgi:hypothetical protein
VTLSRRLIILGAVCIAAGGTAVADDAAPLDWVKEAYAAYRGQKAKGISLKDEPPSDAISSHRWRH